MCARNNEGNTMLNSRMVGFKKERKIVYIEVLYIEVVYIELFITKAIPCLIPGSLPAIRRSRAGSPGKPLMSRTGHIWRSVSKVPGISGDR